MLKIGQRVKIKPVEVLIPMTGIKADGKAVKQKSGLFFRPSMLQYGGQSGVITEIVHPGDIRRGDINQLLEPSYKIGAVELFWTENMLVKVK